MSYTQLEHVGCWMAQLLKDELAPNTHGLERLLSENLNGTWGPKVVPSSFSGAGGLAMAVPAVRRPAGDLHERLQDTPAIPSNRVVLGSHKQIYTVVLADNIADGMSHKLPCLL